MNGKELTRAVAKATGCHESMVDDILREVWSQIKEAVTRGETVKLRNFGAFIRQVRKPKKAQNLRTNSVVEIPQMSVPKFKPSAEFKSMVNENKI